MAYPKNLAIEKLEESEEAYNVRSLSRVIAANFDGTKQKTINEMIECGWYIDDIAHDDRSDYVRVYFRPLTE